MNNNETILTLLFLFFIFFLPKNPVEEKTIYFASCSDFKHSIHDCPARIDITKSEFKVVASTQKVARKSLLWIDNTKQCEVFDKNNWQCSFDNGKSWERVSEGNYYISSGLYVTKGKYAPRKGTEPTHRLTEQISWLEYHIRYIKGMI